MGSASGHNMQLSSSLLLVSIISGMPINAIGSHHVQTTQWAEAFALTDINDSHLASGIVMLESEYFFFTLT